MASSVRLCWTLGAAGLRRGSTSRSTGRPCAMRSTSSGGPSSAWTASCGALWSTSPTRMTGP
eukprot:15462859-Alexandrium_andersonii.AAC.1